MIALKVLPRARNVIAVAAMCVGLGSFVSPSTASAAPEAPAAPEAAGAAGQAATDPFYTPPSPLPPGDPGDLIRSEPTTVSMLPGLPYPGTNAWRIMYRSTSATDQPIAVTGTLMVPRAAWSGGGPRPLVTYALGSHGMGQQCTPSIQFRQGVQFELGVITNYLNQGWAVVVTDYQRRPNHTYVNSKASGQAVLDAARAAAQVGGSGLSSANPVGISGYSQGGNAAAAAAERQPAYAPELDVRGVAAGGVPADLAAVARAVDRDVLFGTVIMAVASLRTAYPELTLEGLNATGRTAVDQVTRQCIAETTMRWAFRSATELTVGGRTVDQFLAAYPAWGARLDEQRIGRLRPAVPVLLYQGQLDPWVPHAVTERLAADWCARGANVQFSTYPIAEHFGGLIEAVPQVLSWLSARFAGTPATGNC